MSARTLTACWMTLLLAFSPALAAESTRGTQNPSGTSAGSAQSPASGDPVLAPEGLRMGIPVAEAARRLAASGFMARTSSCHFSRPLPGGGGREEIVLVFTDLTPPRLGQLGQAMACAERAEDRFILSGLTRKEYVDRASQHVRPMEEIDQLVERLGPYARCNPTPAAANACAWRAPAADPRIKTVTISLSRSWGRQIVIEGEPLEILPVVAERTAGVDAAAREAQAVCESGGLGETVQALTDCACVARNVGRAYARGLVTTRIDGPAISRYTGNCPSSVERLRAFFETRCFSSFATMLPTWTANGGCRCVGDKAAQRYRADPESSAITGLLSGNAGACGFKGTDAASVVPPEYRK